MINLYNIKMLLKMLVDKKLLMFVKDAYLYFKKDPNFSKLKAIRSFLTVIKNDKIVEHEGKYVLTNFLPPIPSKAIWSNFKATDTLDSVYTDHYEIKRTGPISFYLCLTNQCPNKCVYCSNKGRKEVGTELTTEQWINTIKTIQEMGTAIVGFTGGEPLLRRDIVELVSSIDDRSISTIFTSGVNLTQDMAIRLKKAGLFSLGISAPVADTISDRFITSVRAIINSSQAGIYTCVHVVITKDMIDEGCLFTLFRCLRFYGANEIRIFEPIFSGNLLNKDVAVDTILYTAKDRCRLLKLQNKANRVIKGLKVSSDPYNESKYKYGCSAGTQHSYISAVGDLYPCDFFPLSFGNVLRDDLSIIWRAMKDTIKYPKTFCMAQKFNKENINKQLPIYDIINIDNIISDTDIPDVYKKLKGI